MSSPARRITVTIDELVLHGFDRREAHRIADALRIELGAAIDGLAPTAGITITRLDAGATTVPPGSAPDLIGRAVAAQIGHAMPGYGAGALADAQHLADGERRS